MVTDPSAAPDTESVAASPEGTDTQQAEQPSVEELQKRLDAAEQRARSAEGRLKQRERSAAINGEALADLEERMASTMTNALKQAFETDDPVERNRRLGEIEAQRKQQADLARRITDAQPRLDSLIGESGKEFSDPAFDEARTAWDGGRPEEAIALARIAVNEARSGNTYTKEEVDAMVESSVKNALSSANQVDTGSSTVATSSAAPTTRAELAQYMAQRRAQGNPIPASEHAALIQGLRN